MIHFKRISLFSTAALAIILLTGCGSVNNVIEKSTTGSETKSSSTSQSKATTSSQEESKTTPDSRVIKIKQNLITYTNEKSPGPTKNYYYDNGKSAEIHNVKSGSYLFQSDNNGRSGTAVANLTYNQFEESKGSRQGTPLDPPYWPTNMKTAITYSLTDRTYHGFLWNRSHSIADSLLGAASYDSVYNFTAGTRPQNVGANQKGGMRYAESMVENYWRSNPNTNQTVLYQTTPVYEANERIPRGSIVDIKSSDGKLDSEIVVINSAEGHEIDYK